MPRTKSQKTARSAPAVAANGPHGNEVLTLAEAAAYLRVSEAEVVRLVQHQDLPARLLGTEWRFLKAAINDWLRTPPQRGSREAVLSAAGSLKDDPYLETELKEIYRRRGRPMTEDGK